MPANCGAYLKALGRRLGKACCRAGCGLLILAWVSAGSARLQASQSLYQFSGKVSKISPSVPYAPFGFELAHGLPVSGKFMFDLASSGAVSPTDPNRVDYAQTAANGFSARFGNLQVWVDKYMVTVVNNLTQPSGGAADAISISFDASLGPLFVDGVPHADGQFSINFLGSASLFDAPALPTNIPLASYPSPLGIFSESPRIITGTISILGLQKLNVLPGDYDLNQTVDGADMLLWQRTTGAAGTLCDGNGDLTVDGADLVVWCDNLGASLLTPSSAASSPVPEPATAVNVAAALVAGLAYRRRRRHVHAR